MSLLERMLKQNTDNKKRVLETPPPIPCKGKWHHSINGDYFDCDYEYACWCEDCIVNGGPIDPREDLDEEQR